MESIPKSAPAPDLAPIEQKVAQVDRLSQQVEAIGKKVDPLSQKSRAGRTRIAELDRKLDDSPQAGDRRAGRALERAEIGRSTRPAGNARRPRPAGIRPSPGEGDGEPASGSRRPRASRRTRPSNPE